MLPFQEEQLKKAAESILQYTEVLAATYDGVRSDLLVASVWYCLKEEQKKVQRLEEALKIQSTEPQKRPSEPPKQVITPAKDSKTDSAKKTVTPGTKDSNKVPTSLVVLLQPKTSTDKTETKSSKEGTKSKPATADKERRTSSDSDVCIIEIDDDEEEVKKNDKPASKKENKTETKIKQKESDTSKPKATEPTKGNTQNQKATKAPVKPVKTFPAPAKYKKDQNKEIDKDKPKEITKDVEETIILDEDDETVEQDTGNSSDHEMFDMDCEEIQDEPMRKSSANKTPDKIIKPSEKAKAASILEETESNESKEESQKSPRTRSQSKSEKGNKQNDKKKAKDKSKSEDQIENINVIFEESDDEDDTNESKTAKEGDPKTSENAENDKTDKKIEKNEQAPFPMTLTQNIAGQSDNVVADTGENQMDSSNNQQYTTVLPQDQNNAGAGISPDQYTGLSQTVENSSVINVSATVNGQFIIPGANVMENMVGSRQQYVQQPMNDTAIIHEVKREMTEVDVDAVHGIAPSPVQGLMPPQGVQGMVGHQGIPGMPQHLAGGQGMMPHTQSIQGMVPSQGMQGISPQLPEGVQGMNPLQRLQGMIPSGQGMGPQPPPGFIYNPVVQGPSGFVDPQFSRQQFLPPNSNPVSLSSLTSGALTYPYSSTESVPGLYGSRQPGMIPGQPGYIDPAYQQQLGLQQIPDPDMTDQGRKRGKPGENISPPTKKRLLDFDRKWHEGPSSSKGQERCGDVDQNVDKITLEKTELLEQCHENVDIGSSQQARERERSNENHVTNKTSQDQAGDSTDKVTLKHTNEHKQSSEQNGQMPCNETMKQEPCGELIETMVAEGTPSDQNIDQAPPESNVNNEESDENVLKSPGESSVKKAPNDDYKVKTPSKRKKWSNEAMKNAVDYYFAEIDRGNTPSLRGISKEFRVPKTTLYEKVTGRTPIDAKSGPKPTVPFKDEMKIFDYIKASAQIGFSKSRQQIIDLVANYVKKAGIRNRFKDGRPGKDWWEKFVARWPQLSLFNPVVVARQREVALRNYSCLMLEMLEKYDLLNSPEKIYVTGQTKLVLDPNPLKRIKTKDDSENMNKGEKKLDILVFTCASASGVLLPHQLAFKETWNISEDMLALLPPDTRICKSSNDKTEVDWFESWVTEHFQKYVPLESPVLLLVNGHDINVGLHLASNCKRDGLIIYPLPPDKSGKLHPLEQGYFKLLREKFKEEVRHFQKENTDKVISKHECCSLIGRAHAKSESSSVIIDSFRECGVFPFNSELVNKTEHSAPLNIENALNTIESSSDIGSALSAMGLLDELQCQAGPSVIVKTELEDEFVAVADSVKAAEASASESHWEMDTSEAGEELPEADSDEAADLKAYE